MRKKRKSTLIYLLLFLLLSVAIGYALLTQDLTINGTTKVKGNTWDIHFNNIQVNTNSVSLSTGDSAATINANDDTLVEYTVTLNTPGDYYEFTVDAVNDGTIDGMIGSVVSKLNGTSISTKNPLPAYLDYKVTYEDGQQLGANHILAANDNETYRIRIEFKKDIENADLPTTTQTNTFSFKINFIQMDSNGIERPRTYTYIFKQDSETMKGVTIGQAIPAGIPTYDNYEDLLADYGHNFFLAITQKMV